jgi:hypothetical protein
MLSIGKIIWAPADGEIAPDDAIPALALDAAARLRAGADVRVGGGALLNQLRVLVARGELPPVTVAVGAEDIPMLEHGGLPNWPAGLDALVIRQVSELGRARRAARPEGQP